VKILLLTQYYPPEVGAAQNRLSALVRSCRRRGISVTVLTAMPNYPTGRVSDQYRTRWMIREIQDGVDVIRTWIWPRPGNGWLSRGLTYSSFALSSLVTGWLHAPRTDLLIWETPPLVLGPTAYLLSRFKGARLVTNVSDLWPASLTALGVLREGFLLRILKNLEEFVYRKSAAISGQTEHIATDIRNRVPEVPVILWRNGVDARAFAHGDATTWRVRWHVPAGHFVVGYAGLFGISQGLEVICHAASQLCNIPVTFVMVGHGPSKQGLIDLASRLGLTNFLWIPSCPHEEMPGIWRAFDCAVVCLRNLPLFRGAVPSKMYEAMAAGVPIILGVKGEAAEVIRDSGAGITVEPENADQMANAIGTLHADPAGGRQMGENGRRAAHTLYDREAINGRYIDGLLRALHVDTTLP